jgi:hypothetical protein
MLVAGCVVVLCAFFLPVVFAELPGGSAVRAASVVALRVIPFPGTPDASPSTGVIFSALRPSDLRSVTVKGSRSGRHPGRLEALPAGGGTEFLPGHAFTPGETVRVTAELTSRGAGTASGEPGATHLSFSFRVRVPVPTPLVEGARWPAAAWQPGARLTSGSPYGPTQSFRSEPDLHPPVLTATSDPDLASGDIFAGVLYGSQGGPMILNPQGQLVWFLPGRQAANFAVQHYRGHPVLTWWQRVGSDPREDVIVNGSYRTVAVVHGADGLTPDAHDFQITPQGTAFLSTAIIVDANLSSVGGPVSGTAIDDIVQEVDIRTGQLLWEWHSLGHIPLSASYGPVPDSSWPPYDYFHLNSIQQLPDGNLLISARQTWAAYEISRRNGRVIWTVGGKYSDFAMGQGTRFEWQHDVRLYGHTMSVFDDAATPPEESQSSGKLLRLNPSRRTVSLIKRFTHDPPVITPQMGSVQMLPNGNVFVGWGPVPEFSEYTSAGRQIFNVTAPLGVVFYRAYRFPWVGRPNTRPALAVSRSKSGRTILYASWNGATQVVDWRVLGGPTSHHLKSLGVTAPRRGFETTIKLASHPRYLAVQALGSKGDVLGTSAPAQARR